jgi:predicted RNase H-like HicB family nuclease
MEPLHIAISGGTDLTTFTADVEWDPEANQYVGVVRGVHGAHTQAETLDQLQKALREVLELCLEEDSKPTMEHQ